MRFFFANATFSRSKSSIRQEPSVFQALVPTLHSFWFMAKKTKYHFSGDRVSVNCVMQGIVNIYVVKVKVVVQFGCPI